MDSPPGLHLLRTQSFQSAKGQKNLITNSHWAQRWGSELSRFHRTENLPVECKPTPAPAPALQPTPADPSGTLSSEARAGLQRLAKAPTSASSFR